LVGPYITEIDSEQNVTTIYALDMFGCLSPIYTLHFFAATKLWKIKSDYVALEINKDFFTFSEIRSFEEYIKQNIPEFYDRIKTECENSAIN
jgi:hypothetical protein